MEDYDATPPLYRLEDDESGHENEEDCVGEAREHLEAAVAASKGQEMNDREN